MEGRRATGACPWVCCSHHAPQRGVWGVWHLHFAHANAACLPRGSRDLEGVRKVGKSRGRWLRALCLAETQLRPAGNGRSARGSPLRARPAVPLSRPPQVGAGGARLRAAEVKGARAGRAQRRAAGMRASRAPAPGAVSASWSRQDLAVSPALLEESCTAVRLPFRRKPLPPDALE